jgi:hypothetical protein
MAVAIRLRHLNKRESARHLSPGDALRGIGYETLLPVPLATLASEAMLEFLLQDPVINRGVDRLVTVGPFDAGAARLPATPCPASR